VPGTTKKKPTEEIPAVEVDDLKERIDALEHIAYTVHGYVDDKGEHDHAKVVDMLLVKVLEAECHVRKERKKVAVKRAAMMEHTFPQVPDRGEFDEQDDPEATEGLYNRLDTRLLRFLDANHSGAVQLRLNGEHALILCRTNATDDGSLGFYVTRDWQCLVADFTGPDKNTIEKAILRMGMNVKMAGERAPEHQKKLKRELTISVRDALAAGVAPITALIEAGVEVDPESSEDDDK